MGRVLIMVGTTKGAFFYRSHNEARDQWEFAGPVLKGWEVIDMQLDQRPQASKIYACVDHIAWAPTIQTLNLDHFDAAFSGSSQDVERRWCQVQHGPRYREGANRQVDRIWRVTPGPRSQPEVLYAGVSQAGLFRSSDSGETWQEVEGLNNHPTREEWVPGLGGLMCHHIVLDPVNDDRMWVAISVGGVFRTDDGGATWKMRNDGLPVTVPPDMSSDIIACVHCLVVDPDTPDVLYQQNHQGVFRSTNAGDNWERIEKGLPTEEDDAGRPMMFGMPMVMHTSDSKTLYVVPEEKDYYRFCPDGRLAVYRTRDGGESWNALRKGLSENLNYAGVLRYSMAADELEECGIYFGTTCGQLFYSRNAGDSWQAMPETLPRILSVNVFMVD